MNNLNWPFNAVQPEGEPPDDRGKRVVINSVGGALQDVHGTVVWGPCKLWYTFIEKISKTKNKKKTVITEPYWGVLVDDYKLELTFCEKELTFKTQ